MLLKVYDTVAMKLKAVQESALSSTVQDPFYLRGVIRACSFYPADELGSDSQTQGDDASLQDQASRYRGARESRYEAKALAENLQGTTCCHTFVHVSLWYQCR